ncbi:NAD-dependent protein deacylase [Clostridium sp.]|uniref:NAD-dependent protein deacylase n=1 Tax=Clostridium sp. TaxID=1506 RepID=UPI002FCB33D1
MSIAELKEIINKYDNIVFFGGAGVSTESNIPDFRSANGLYNESTKSHYSPEEILSHSFFINHTKAFYEFYRDKMIYKDAEPNAAHLVLAELERRKKLKAVITQNIDGLHQKAGNEEVVELHGSIHRNYCMECNKFFPLDYIISSTDIPRCDVCGHIVKPDVVLYEEELDSNVLRRAISFIEKAEVLIVGGTSLTVYPAAGLLRYYSGEKLILINKSATQYDSRADLVIYDKIGETLKQVL